MTTKTTVLCNDDSITWEEAEETYKGCATSWDQMWAWKREDPPPVRLRYSYHLWAETIPDESRSDFQNILLTRSWSYKEGVWTEYKELCMEEFEKAGLDTPETRLDHIPRIINAPTE